ncbi:Na+/H+ antiporter subunit E [Rubrivirga sp.]|uniref:Na+/H+ antiporter subunit E n=1 Tax=Rubrivirga sp. TaxID=1885344 RepID=UPI003C74968D
MKLFLLNILLALLWGAVNGTFGAVPLLAGFVLGYLVLLLARPAFGPSAYYSGLWRGVGFVLFYVYELVLSSVRVAFDVLTPRLRAVPGIIAVPIDAKTDTEITVLANLISLTPGTLSLLVSPDRKTLYVHAMYLDDGPDAVRDDLKSDMERRVLRLFRLEEPAAPTTA